MWYTQKEDLLFERDDVVDFRLYQLDTTRPHRFNLLLALSIDHTHTHTRTHNSEPTKKLGLDD